MKHILFLILGILLVILTSATTVSVMTVKPATPKSVIVFNNNDIDETQYKIKEYTKKGYIVKTISSNGDYHKSWIVVMEKY